MVKVGGHERASLSVSLTSPPYFGADMRSPGFNFFGPLLLSVMSWNTTIRVKYHIPNEECERGSACHTSRNGVRVSALDWQN